MSWTVLILVILHVLPVVMVFVTWNMDASNAIERIVRVQVIATAAYFLIGPIAGILDWPNNQLSDFTFSNILGWWGNDGPYLMITTAALVTATVIFIRRQYSKSRKGPEA